MRLLWTQLQAVVFFILVLLDINLVFACSEFQKAEEKLNDELEPFINPIFGYLPAMPYLTVHSVLVSLMVEEYDIKEYSDFNFTDKSPEGFRNTEVAASMAVYLKQMRPFKKDPFGIELTGLLLERIAKEVTSVDLANERLNLGLVLMPAWTSSFVRRCYAVVRNSALDLDLATLKNMMNQCRVRRTVLVDYTISSWHKIQLQPKVTPTVTKSNWSPNLFLEELSTCTEAALRWTVFETVKNRFESDLKKHVFQDVLDDFLASMDDNQDQAKLLAYTIQLGVHYHLLVATETGKLQVEFHELLKGSSQVGPEVKKFNHFLAYLGLVNGTFNKEELAFKFENQDFARIDVDLNVSGWKDFFKGLKPFDLANTTAESLRWSPFFAIFEGFTQYQNYDDEFFLNQNVFKWRQVMHFIVSYGHMFKKVALKGLPIEAYEVPATDPPTAPATEPATAPPTALSTAAQSTVPGTGYLNQTQGCCNNFSWWKELLAGGLATALGYKYWPKNITATSYLANLFGASSTTTLTPTVSTASTSSRSGFIIMLLVWAMLVAGGGIGWWYTKSQTETKKKTTDQKKKTKANQKVASSPRTSPLSTLAFSRQTPSTSPVGSSKDKAVFPCFSLRTKTNIAAFKRPASKVLTTTTTSPARSTVLKSTASSPSSTSSQTKASKAAQSSLKQAKVTIK